MKHFSHSHSLELSEVSEGKEIICACCEESLTAGEESFFCTKFRCKFSLHKTCSDFPKKIQHKCDPKHKLVLHSQPPSGYYACNACDENFNGFIYHCEKCDIYIHAKCAFVPEIVKRDDHEHPLKLYYSAPSDEDDYFTVFNCDVCQAVALSSAWIYYCSECDYGTHFGCVNAEPVQKESSEEEEETFDSEHDEDKLAIWGAVNKDEDHEGAVSPEKKCIKPDVDENPHQHFSHPHELISLVLIEEEEINCNGCDTQIQQPPFHGCIRCKYYLHDSCLKTPRFLQHPFHPHHALTLLPTPTYPTRSFICDACGCSGNSFCFSCAQCDRDLHPQCASLPQQLNDPEKHDHVLNLVYGFSSGRSCDVCEKTVDASQWVYNCRRCDYDAHLRCVESGFSVPVEEREDEVQTEMSNMNAGAVTHMRAMNHMARLQFQINAAYRRPSYDFS